MKNIILNTSSATYVEKKSKFIATITPIFSVSDAENFYKDMKKQYYDARHNVFAYTINFDNPIEKYSDDGEPSLTAGFPIMKTIQGYNLSNVFICVTRYFGGILLGTGGLVKAYTEASKLAIENSNIISVSKYTNINILCDYDNFNQIKYFFSKYGLIYKIDYTDKVLLDIFIKQDQLEKITDEYINLTNNNYPIKKINENYIHIEDSTIKHIF